LFFKNIQKKWYLKVFKKIEPKILDVDNNEIYLYAEESNPNSLYFRLSKNDKYVNLGVMNGAYF
jgi:hypothetical protein